MCIRDSHKAMADAKDFERRDLANQLHFVAKQEKEMAEETFKEAKRRYDLEAGEMRTPGPTESPVPSVTGWNLVYDNENAEYINRKFAREGRETLGIIQSVASFMRVPLTVVDWSVPLVQNLFLLGRDPGLWGKAAYHGAMRFQDPKFMQQFITEKRASVHRMIQSGVLFRSSDVMHGLEEGDWLAGYAVRGIEKLPVGEAAQTALKTGPWGVTKLLKTFGNVYEVQLDVAKIFLWESLEHMAIDAKSKADLGAFVNKATGTLPGGAFGVSRTQQQAESGIFFFAPAYTRAHSALLVDAISQGGVRGEVARDSIAKLFMFLVHTHIAGASLTGCLLYTSPSPRDRTRSRMPSSA